MNRGLLLATAVLRRTLSGLALLVGASFLIYATVRSAPGDAIDAISPMGTEPEVKAQLAAEFGLDRDIVTGYGHWLARSATGDFGESLVLSAGEKVSTLMLPAYRRTVLLSGAALAVCLFLGLLGSIILGRPGSRERWLTSSLYFVTAAPSFIAAFFFAQVANYTIHRFVEQAGQTTPEWYPIPIFSESFMPYVFAGFVLVIGDGLFMDTFNALRSELLNLRNSQFIAAVRAKGAGTARHIARNMVVPVISAYASRLPLILGGAVIVEYMFTIEGAGYILLEAARERDFPVVVGVSVCFTATIIVVNVLADLVRAAVDPREAAHGG